MTDDQISTVDQLVFEYLQHVNGRGGLSKSEILKVDLSAEGKKLLEQGLRAVDGLHELFSVL